MNVETDKPPPSLNTAASTTKVDCTFAFILTKLKTKNVE